MSINYNKDHYRPINITHRTTGDVRTFLVKCDGSEIISCAHRIASGKFNRTRVQKFAQMGTGLQYQSFNWNIRTEEKDNNNHNLYVHRLVWAAWCNDGVMPPNGNAFHVDHINQDHTNNHYSNLQLLTSAEHRAKTKEYNRAKELENNQFSFLIPQPNDFIDEEAA